METTPIHDALEAERARAAVPRPSATQWTRDEVAPLLALLFLVIAASVLLIAATVTA